MRGVTEVFSGKWSFPVLEQLRVGTMRFNELQRALGVSTMPLTDTLRHLEANGIVHREAKPTGPVTVEDSLTDKACAFHDLLLAMKAWSEEWLDA